VCSFQSDGTVAVQQLELCEQCHVDGMRQCVLRCFTHGVVQGTCWPAYQRQGLSYMFRVLAAILRYTVVMSLILWRQSATYE
jgi:hypothetical protein